jgi:SAM-dependent methyltransferase
MNDPDRDAGHAYVFGHSDRELDRLKAQARLIDPITQRFLREAGVVPGMRVLDVGSGAGDVAFLASDMVGDTGEVVGIDRVPVALEAARARAAFRSLRNVVFREGNAPRWYSTNCSMRLSGATSCNFSKIRLRCSATLPLTYALGFGCLSRDRLGRRRVFSASADL